MDMTKILIVLADSYAGAAGLSRGRIATLIFNDGKALDRIANGGDLTTRSYEKAMAWFSAKWPEGAIWPEGVTRPVIAAETQAVA